jgi:hypothetical protein
MDKFYRVWAAMDMERRGKIRQGNPDPEAEMQGDEEGVDQPNNRI